jgi:hypothetical protein
MLALCCFGTAYFFFSFSLCFVWLGLACLLVVLEKICTLLMRTSTRHAFALVSGGESGSLTIKITPLPPLACFTGDKSSLALVRHRSFPAVRTGDRLTTHHPTPFATVGSKL